MPGALGSLGRAGPGDLTQGGGRLRGQTCMNHSTVSAEPGSPFLSLHQAGAKGKTQVAGGAREPGDSGDPWDSPSSVSLLQEGRVP